jgi:hypothetical protein
MVSQTANQPFVPPTSYQVEKIPGYFNSGDEDEAEGSMPNMQGANHGTFSNISLGQMRGSIINTRAFQGNPQPYKMPNSQQLKRMDAKAYGGGGMARAQDFKGTASFPFDNFNGSAIQQSNSMHQADDRAYFPERGYGGSGHRQGLMANQPFRRNPATRNNNYMVGSMPRQDYSAK